MEAGEQITVTEVIVGGTFTVTVALPDFVESCVDVAVIIALPVPVGVKRPRLLFRPLLSNSLRNCTLRYLSQSTCRWRSVW